VKAKVTYLPDEHHVMRHVKWKLLRKDDDGINAIGFLPQAFELGPKDEYLSVNWIEHGPGDWGTRIRDSVWGIRRARPSIGGGGKSRYAIGNVRTIKEVCLRNTVRVRITHEPETNNLGHSGIRRLPRDDLTLLEALADDAFTEMVENADIPSEQPGTS
jgi:hypothetical protein